MNKNLKITLLFSAVLCIAFLVVMADIYSYDHTIKEVQLSQMDSVPSELSLSFASDHYKEFVYHE